MDETDVYIDSHTKQRVQRSELGPMDRAIRMTPMQLSACASFLNNSVKSFNQVRAVLPIIQKWMCACLAVRDR